MTEKTIHLEEISPLDIFGVNDEKIELIKSYFPQLKIVARGHEIKVAGTKKEINSFDEKVAHANASGQVGGVLQSSVKRKGNAAPRWDERFVLRIPPAAALPSASDDDGEESPGGAGSNLEVHLRLSDGTKASLRNPRRTGRAQCIGELCLAIGGGQGTFADDGKVRKFVIPNPFRETGGVTLRLAYEQRSHAVPAAATRGAAGAGTHATKRR